MNHLIGQFHPLLVHLPIGILIIAFVFKLWSLRSEDARYKNILSPLTGCAFLVSIATAFTGYMLSLVGGYEDELLNYHKWSGFSMAVLSGLLFIAVSKRWNQAIQNIAWWSNALGIVITGHLGGQLTHGTDYLSFNLRTYQKPVIKNIDSALIYHDIIEPILADKCWSCHSFLKQKGSLRLDGIDHILQGGKHGDVISLQLDQSKMYHKLTLPKSDDGHMPPSGQPQPTSEEIKLIGWWMQEDITKDKMVIQSILSPEIKSILSEITDEDKVKSPALIPSAKIDVPDAKILANLNRAGIVAIPIAQNSNYLQVVLRPQQFQKSNWNLLKNIGKNIAWLSVKQFQLDDTAWNSIVEFDHLVKLDLSQSSINDTTIQKLASLTMLRSLNLNRTSVTEKGLMALANLKSLQSIYLFQSKVNPKAWAQLKNTFPNTIIDTGNYLVPMFPADTTEYTYEQLAKDKNAKSIPK